MAKRDKYSKPGKGVKKNQPEKRAFFAFIDLYFSKFWNMIKINLIMFVCFIPLITALTLPLSGAVYIVGLMIIQALLLGPCLCGVSYLMRNYCAGSHAWVWSDFKDMFIDNYKYGFVMGVIDMVVVWLLYVANNYYTKITGGIMGDIFSAVITVVFALFIMINMYVYPMIVTFDNTFSSHLKNALVFTLANLPKSVLAFVIDAVLSFGLGYLIYAVIPMPFSIIVMLILLMFFVFSFMGLINMFAVWPSLKPHIVVEEEDEDCGTETLFSDELIINDKEDE